MFCICSRSIFTWFEIFITSVIIILFLLYFVLIFLSRSYNGHCGFSYHVASANSAILEKLWSRVQIEPFSKEELTEVS